MKKEQILEEIKNLKAECFDISSNIEFLSNLLNEKRKRVFELSQYVEEMGKKDKEKQDEEVDLDNE